MRLPYSLHERPHVLVAWSINRSRTSTSIFSWKFHIGPMIFNVVFDWKLPSTMVQFWGKLCGKLLNAAASSCLVICENAVLQRRKRPMQQLDEHVHPILTDYWNSPKMRLNAKNKIGKVLTHKRSTVESFLQQQQQHLSNITYQIRIGPNAM